MTGFILGGSDRSAEALRHPKADAAARLKPRPLKAKFQACLRHAVVPSLLAYPPVNWRAIFGRSLRDLNLKIKGGRTNASAATWVVVASDKQQVLRLRMTSTSWASCCAQDDRGGELTAET